MNYILQFFSAFWRWLFGASNNSSDRPYSTIYTNLFPEELKNKTIYVSGEDGQEWFVLFLCPCGCQEKIQLSILQNTKPKWKLIKHENGTVSLHPSVWRTKGCRSHFFFQQGYINWCPPTEASLPINSIC